jgi:hypothetical protein
MGLSLAQVREAIQHESEPVLKQRLENARGKERYLEYFCLIQQELDSRFPGWQKPRTRRGGTRTTIARFRGREEECDTAKAAYIWLVERFAAVNPQLFTDVRWETTGYVGVGRRRGRDGAARNYFARSPAKLFRRTPSLADRPTNFHRLLNGWYVNLNLNTRENFEILCRFAAVSRLEHGKDWDWEVLDPTEELHDARHRALMARELMAELDEILSQAKRADA